MVALVLPAISTTDFLTQLFSHGGGPGTVDARATQIRMALQASVSAFGEPWGFAGRPAEASHDIPDEHRDELVPAGRHRHGL